MVIKNGNVEKRVAIVVCRGEQLWVLVQQIFPLFPGCFNLSVSPSVNFVSLTPPFPFDALSII